MSAILERADGLHLGVPDAEYHARIPGLASKGALDEIERSGAHYEAWLKGAMRPETTALRFGKAFHCATLEPDVFAATYVVEPEFGDCRFKEAKAIRDAWRIENVGRIALPADDWTAIVGMSAKVRAHSRAGKMLQGGVSELTLKWTDAETGIVCKARGDYHVDSVAMCLDLKTCEDARAAAVERSVGKWGYHRQQAHYADGFEAVGAPLRAFVFVFVEKVPPYELAVFMLDDDAQRRGAESIRKSMQTLATCIETGSYPGYPEEIQTLELPAWA